jgi:hypothetical protein
VKVISTGSWGCPAPAIAITCPFSQNDDLGTECIWVNRERERERAEVAYLATYWSCTSCAFVVGTPFCSLFHLSSLRAAFALHNEHGKTKSQSVKPPAKRKSTHW